MTCPFQVGDEVVCINLDIPTALIGSINDLHGVMPVIGKTYVLTQVRPVERPPAALPERFHILVQVAGIPTICDDCGQDCMLFACWFEKVEKRSTERGMEILRGIDRDVFKKETVKC